MASEEITNIVAATRSRSSSSGSESETKMQIFIKPVTGEAFSLSIPASTPIGTLRTLLALRTNTPEKTLRILHDSKQLSTLSETLESYKVAPGSTLQMALPAPTPVSTSKRPRCNFKDCRDAAQRIVGDCGFCNGKFCAKHRMLESHMCSKLAACKAEEKERNREKLESERTYAIRGL